MSAQHEHESYRPNFLRRKPGLVAKTLDGLYSVWMRASELISTPKNDQSANNASRNPANSSWDGPQ